MHIPRIVSALTAAALLATNAQSAFAAFLDVPQGDFDGEAITYLQTHDIMKGKPQEDGRLLFDPDASLNRAELVTILVRTLGLSIDVGSESCFSDVTADAWYFSAICSAEAMGLISGYPDGRFKPSQSVNKVEALKIIENALGLPSDVEMYANNQESDTWFGPYVTLAQEWGWFDEGRDAMAPDAMLKRRDAAHLLYRGILTTMARTLTGELPVFSGDLVEQYADHDIEIYGMQEADLLEALYANSKVYRNDRLGFSMMLPKTMPTYMCDYEKPAEIVGVVALENGEDVYIGPAWYETNSFEGTNPDGSGIYGECVRREIEANDDEYYARKITTQKVDSDADIEKFIKKNYGEDCGPFERSPSMQNGIEDISVVNVPRAGVDEPSGLDDFACVTNYLYVLKYNPATKRILSIHLGQDGFFYLPGEDGQFGAALDMTMVRTLRMY